MTFKVISTVNQFLLQSFPQLINTACCRGVLIYKKMDSFNSLRINGTIPDQFHKKTFDRDFISIVNISLPSLFIISNLLPDPKPRYFYYNAKPIFTVCYFEQAVCFFIKQNAGL